MNSELCKMDYNLTCFRMKRAMNREKRPLVTYEMIEKKSMGDESSF